MTNLEIKQKIDEKNELIKIFFDPNKFILNNDVKKLLEEIEDLQKQCTHKFVDGYCEYCYIRENKE